MALVSRGNTIMADNLLRDAIMEAKQVKAAAIASAKIALEEAFQPHLQSMLSRQLRNEAVPNSSSGIGTGNNKEPEGFDSSNIPNPAQELDSMGENPAGINHTIGGSRKAANNQTDAHPINLHEEEFPFDNEEDEDEEGLPGDNQEEPVGEEEPEGGEELDFGGEGEGGEGGEGSVEEKLDALLDIVVDLKGQIDALTGAEGGAPEDGMGDEFGGQPGGEMAGPPEDELGGEFGEEEPRPEEDEAYSRMYEETLDGTANEQLPFGKKGVGHSKIGGSSKTGMGPNKSTGLTQVLRDVDEPETVDEDIDLNEILREMDVQENIQRQGTDPNYYAKVEQIMSENANLKRSLTEHRDVVRFLKDRITEINMLNAKLLFTNKLFKQFDLNGGQKMRVVENFDRATTLREVKLIFATLGEAYAAKNSAATKKVRSITEGLASRVTGSTKPKNPALLTESDDVVKRFKQLAHIL